MLKVNNKRKGGKKKNGNNKGSFKAIANIPVPSQVSGVKLNVVKRKPVKTKGKQMQLMQHVHATCSILDPFCVHAKAAKRPDGMGANSITTQVRGVITISTSALGGAFFILSSGLGRYGWVTGTLAAGDWTTGAAWNALTGSEIIQAHAKEIRIVSFGAVIRSIGSATSAQGFTIASSLANPRLSTPYSAGRVDYSESGLHSNAAGTEYQWISKPIGNKAHEFRDYATVTSTMTDFDWTSLALEISGGPVSLPVITVEWYYNVEFTLTEGTSTSLAQMVPPSKPSNKVAIAGQEKAQSSMSSFFTGTVEKATESLAKTASTALLDVMKEGMSWLPFAL